MIPLPIPHPVHIAIAIHNRDTEQPIPLDSELCWDILRAIEDCQGDVEVSFFFIYRMRVAMLNKKIFFVAFVGRKYCFTISRWSR